LTFLARVKVQEFPAPCESVLQTGTNDPLPGSHTQEELPVAQSLLQRETGADDPLPGSQTQVEFPAAQSDGESEIGLTQM
jgi:hypothetical protein